MTELKPCPFCGGSKFTIDGGGYSEGSTPSYVSMYCDGCFVTSRDFSDTDGLRKFWNTRAPSPDERDEVLRKQLKAAQELRDAIGNHWTQLQPYELSMEIHAAIKNYDEVTK